MITLNTDSAALDQLRAINSMARSSSFATSGNLGLVGDKVVKFNTHLGERLFSKVTGEMYSASNAMRTTLKDLIAKTLAGDAALIKKLCDKIDAGGSRSLLERKIVAKVIAEIETVTEKNLKTSEITPEQLSSKGVKTDFDSIIAEVRSPNWSDAEISVRSGNAISFANPQTAAKIKPYIGKAFSTNNCDEITKHLNERRHENGLSNGILASIADLKKLKLGEFPDQFNRDICRTNTFVISSPKGTKVINIRSLQGESAEREKFVKEAIIEAITGGKYKSVDDLVSMPAQERKKIELACSIMQQGIANELTLDAGNNVFDGKAIASSTLNNITFDLKIEEDGGFTIICKTDLSLSLLSDSKTGKLIMLNKAKSGMQSGTEFTFTADQVNKLTTGEWSEKNNQDFKPAMDYGFLSLKFEIA